MTTLTTSTLMSLATTHLVHNQFYNVPLSELPDLDFRKKQGSDLRKQSQLETPLLKKLIKFILKFAPQIIIQRAVNRWMLKHLFYTKGICYFQPHLSCNDTEPITQEHIQDIPLPYFISFLEDNTYYTFDIRLFHKSATPDFVNPYTRRPLSVINSTHIQRQLQSLRNHHVMLEFETAPLTTSQRAVSLFIDMDQLDNYTNVNWFIHLSMSQLKEWYRRAEDIWNYRAKLTTEQKKKIILNKKVFNLSIREFYKINHLERLQHLVLDEINTLINTSPDRNERKLGCIYVLIAFSEVSIDAAHALQWLSI
jgi:hypothetical protein